MKKPPKPQWNLPDIVDINLLRYLDSLCPFCKKDGVYTLSDRHTCLECHNEWPLKNDNKKGL